MAVLDYQASVLLALATYIVYCAAVILYRLVFHPLAKFPGPKLSACSLWYEFYHDVVREGQWMFRIDEMHKKYGPVVRINPHELHIQDPNFFYQLYANARVNKYQWFCNMAGAPGSMFATVDENVHRMRRKPLENFFSKRAVTDLEPLIMQKVEKLSNRFQRAAQLGDVVRIDVAFMAMTMDVICSYCFGTDRRYLDVDDFGLEWKETINGAWQTGAMMRAFPSMPFMMRYFPRWLANKMDPSIGRLLAWQDGVETDVRRILEDKDDKTNHSIFHTLRDSDLPAQEKSLRRLSEEGEIFTYGRQPPCQRHKLTFYSSLSGAGSETTAKALTTILYYLTTNPTCMSKLKEELGQAMPDPRQTESWSQLEQLPYLSAVIQEGIRMAGSMTTRLPRVTKEAMPYREWIIPAGIPVSQTNYLVLNDTCIFPEPDVFRPERWIEDGQALSKYQIAFGKGSRSCIGINLAHAELFFVCATLIRRFSFELYQTDAKCMEFVHDFFVAFPAKGNEAVRVRISQD